MTLSEEQIKELKEMFPSCPNPLHEPHKFMHYVKMYLTSKGLL
jgi:hypothetical protein